MGVAIASSICLTVNFVINSLMLRKYLPEYSLLSLIPILLKQVPGVIALVLIILTVKKVFSNSILVFGFSALIGLSVYAIILSFMKIEEINLIKEKVTNKMFNR
jgi:putative peptidoglycan lipid II flippase